MKEYLLGNVVTKCPDCGQEVRLGQHIEHGFYCWCSGCQKQWTEYHDEKPDAVNDLFECVAKRQSAYRGPAVPA